MGSGGFHIIFLTAFLLTVSFATAGRGTKIQGSPIILKTIEVDGGEIVDCIHMYKQPAFSHPLLVNHSIQIEPSIKTNRLRTKNGALQLKQSWQKYGKCPKGSIPIKRHQNPNHHFTGRHEPPGPKLGADYHQYAVIQAQPSTNGMIYGVHATLNVWDPTVGPNDFSLSQLWLLAGSGANFNSMEVGWHVYPQIHDNDTRPRIFIYWTNDDYQSSGCYNVQGCPGFVQTNSQFLIGGTLDFSTYGGDQTETELSIQKDTSSGNWWLYVGGNAIGYWPPSLFTTLANAADLVEWGGEVYDNTGGGGLHTSTQMGSGHFPTEGYQKSSYIRSFYYFDTSGSQINPTTEDLGTIVPIPNCYNLQLQTLNDQPYLFFGGPGCQ